MIHLLTVAVTGPGALEYRGRCGYVSCNLRDFAKMEKKFTNTTIRGVTCPDCLKGVCHDDHH